MTKSEYQQLVEFIAPRFDAMDERLRRVEILGEEHGRQLEIVAETVSGNSERLSGVEERLSGVEERLSGVDERLSGVDERLSGVDERLSGVDERLSGVALTLDVFRSEVAAEFQGVRKLIGTSHGELDRRVTRLEEGFTPPHA